MLQVGTYRTVRGELLHYRLDASGEARCEVERADGSLRDGCESCDCDVLLSDDPDWPCSDLRTRASLLIVD
jgi:hypothetical protein